MINMVDGDEKKYFITDIFFDGNSNEIVVKYGDGNETREPFVFHNLQFYRHKMIEQSFKHLPHFLDELSKYSFLVVVRKYIVIIGGILSMVLLYNLDIHIIMKIILSVLIVLGEVGYYLYNEVILTLMGSVVSEGLATETYLKYIDNFRYLNDDKEYEFFLPPEAIARYGLTSDMVEDLNRVLESLKNDGYVNKEITLSYKREEINQQKKN